MPESLRNQKAAYCPECEIHPEQIRGAKRGERLCSSGHVFTLTESRIAEATKEIDADSIKASAREVEK